MPGMYGDYPSSREASGTSWQPESTPVHGRMAEFEDLQIMYHSRVLLGYTAADSPRGNDQIFTGSMFSFLARQPLGGNAFGLRTMVSFDAVNGKKGYPLLLQTGETADGRNPLVDRQHPHDLFMELALTYKAAIAQNSSWYVYAGLPGDPALGPTAYIHRFSAQDDPEAPLSHHWTDSTHITYGVLTSGFILESVKLEGSVFNGREPDEDRWNIEQPHLNSYSARISWMAFSDLLFDASAGYLHSPEQLEPQIDVTRYTSSVSYNRRMSDMRNWQTTFVWGRNDKHPGKATDAFLLESALSVRQDTVFTRLERVEKDELFQPGDRFFGTYTVYKASFGYVRDFHLTDYAQCGIGGVASVHVIPGALEQSYGQRYPCSYLIFVRLKI